MSNKKGYAMVAWTVTFLVLMATLLFIRAPLKRALQGKTMAFADYYFWRAWDNPIQQYKGDITTYAETESNSTQEIRRSEVIKTRNNYPRINQNSSIPQSNETSYSWSVEDEDAQVLLHKLRPDLRQ